MIRDHFRILVADLCTGRARVDRLDGRDEVVGGSGLAALLFNHYGHADRPWDDPDQPLILAVGPLTGIFPLMSKTVCAFKSPYHDQYAESHAGGRSALSLAFAGYDALVMVGRAKRLSSLSIGSRMMELNDVNYLRGWDAISTGRALRKTSPGSGHRTILRIGPAGETLSAMACINVDTFRHFGRLGSGAVMGAKNLKAIIIIGDKSFPAPEGKQYQKLFKEVFQKLTDTDMMSKYHDLGTAGNVAALNELKSLPWRNLKQTSDPGVEGISGERFADDALLRNRACSGCPVGCVHIGFVREKFQKENRYLYRQVSYDYEPIFAVGSMLGVTNAFEALKIMDETEKAGLDVMGAGVALAWATEALEKGIIGPEETIVPLGFGDGLNYQKAMGLLGSAANDFYRLLAKGTLVAANHYGGADFACVLGQEMAGYATGEVFFVAESMGFRHSHLDSGGYAYDQKHDEKDMKKAVDFLVEDEKGRSMLTSMVACLFARGVYGDEQLAEALDCVGYSNIAANMGPIAEHIQKLRWQTRFSTGYDPDKIKIPKRFMQVVTWKGPIDPDYLEALRKEYSSRIRELGRIKDQ